MVNYIELLAFLQVCWWDFGNLRPIELQRVNIPQSAVEWGMTWADRAHPRSLPRMGPPARHGKFPRHPHPPHHRQFPAHQKQNRALFEPSPEDNPCGDSLCFRNRSFWTSTNLDRFRRIPHVCIQCLKTVGPFLSNCRSFCGASCASTCGTVLHDGLHGCRLRQRVWTMFSAFILEEANCDVVHTLSCQGR